MSPEKSWRKDHLPKMHATNGQVMNFIEWLADFPCTGNGSGTLCRWNSPDDPSWCCNPCKAFMLRYGHVPKEE